VSDQSWHAPIDRLVLKEPVPAGLDPYRLLSLVPLLRDSVKDHDPILIRPIGGTGFFRVEDGRHRMVASVMAGRTHVLAELDIRPEP
jgi:hypothetical protein